MKRIVKFALIAVMLLMAGLLSVEAQRGMRSAADTIRPDRPGRWMDVDQMRPMRDIPDSVRMRIDRGIMGPYRYAPERDIRDFGMYGMRRGQYPGMREGYGRGQFRMDRYYPGRDRIQRAPVPRAGIDRPYIERLPGLTDKQREELNNLRQKQFEDMRRFREENLQRMEKFREENRKRMMDVLTPEQRKWIESGTDNKQ